MCPPGAGGGLAETAVPDEQAGRRSNDRQEQPAGHGEPHEHPLQVLRRRAPGLMPEMNPPYFFRLSACSSELNTTAAVDVAPSRLEPFANA